MKTEIKDYYSLEDYNELHKILDHDVPLSFNDQFHKIDRYRHIFRVYYANYFDHEGNPELTRQLVNTVFHYGHKVNKLGSLYLMSTLSKLANKYGVDYNGSELLHILFKNNKKVFDEDYCKVFGILINAQQYEFNEKRFITKFNDVTNELFSQFTLSFLIEGQKHIFEKAYINTKNKSDEINKRVELYETWKNSRKKNKRQQMITGEIPPEQLEFEKDYAILSNELNIYKSISDMLKNDKEKSEKLYESFLNDTNNALKAVQNCRKKYEEYQIELMSLEKYKYNFGINYGNYINKFKNLNFIQSNMLI